MSADVLVADVLVIGGGVAGLSAALAAVEAGARVELLEASSAPGGSALLSNGSLWSFADLSSYLEHCPGADPALAARAVAGLPETIGWLREHGVVVDDRGPSLYGADRSHQVAPAQLVGRLVEALAGGDAVIRLGERVTGLEVGAEGVHATTESGRDIRAGSVVIATGGIHADAALLEAAGLRHYAGLPLRNRPVSGDGVRLALAAGAEFAGTADGIYGHLVPTGLEPVDVTSPLAAQYQSHSGVLVSLEGAVLARPGTDDHDLNRLVTRQPSRRAVLFFDAEAAPPRIRSAVGGNDWAGDRAAFAAAHGRHSSTHGSLVELLRVVAAWGVELTPDAAAAVAGALEVAPFTAVEVQPSITHAGTGIRVDASLRAVGLHNALVAGADIGRGFGDGYGGGLSFALTTGLAAGREAAHSLTITPH